MAAGESPNLINVDDLHKEVESQGDRAYNWTYENGRRYASTELGHYYMPNDAPEIQRLNQQHWLLTELKGGRLRSAPLPQADDIRILDIGCGSGIWSIQMAEEYPNAFIVGMDVAPTQPSKKPANVEWILHDMETRPWPFPPDYFDLIHLSLVHGCVADWDETMRTIVRHLGPGGYVEHQEYSLGRQYLLEEDERTRVQLPEEINDMPSMMRWTRLMAQAGEKRGRTLQLGPELATWQRRAGLLNVNEQIYPLKYGTWPRDEKERNLGAHMLLQTLNGIEGYTTFLFTKALDWSLEDTRTFIAECKRDLRDDNLRKVIDVHVVHGQKPGSKRDLSGIGSKAFSRMALFSSDPWLSLAVGIAVGAAAVGVATGWALRRR